MNIINYCIILINSYYNYIINAEYNISLIKSSFRNAIRCGSTCFMFEEKIVECFVQCHVFAWSPSGRRPNDKYPVNTSHPFDVCTDVSLAVLFGSNGNSSTVSTRSDLCIYTYFLHSVEKLAGQKKLK